MEIAGPAASALSTLTPSQARFLEQLPKAELHAHLNGSIPLSTLKQLAAEHLAAQSPTSLSTDAITQGIDLLVAGPSLEKITDFFGLFPAIYALTSTPAALSRATRAVLSAFLDGDTPQCRYLELRTTPRETHAMGRERYLRVVLAEIGRYRPDQAALIVSLDRRMDEECVRECVRIASELRAEGERVVGIDLCGDPTAGGMDEFVPYLLRAKEAGLGLTLHIAEVRLLLSSKMALTPPRRRSRIPQKRQ
jgi:adenosine deaminase